MPNNHSIMLLHLRYRLWIAEMNADITVLRIFDDYILELSSKKNEPEIKEGITRFQQEFVKLRKEIDELRHEMHLVKMQLSAQSRETKTELKKNTPKDDRAALKKRYLLFRKNFDSVKKEFLQFEGKWLQ